jgi:hypothetical protein
VREQALAVRAVVVEGDVEGVFDGGLVAVGADAAGDGVGRAEEGERLVDKVRAEIEEHAVGGVLCFLPGVLARDRAEAVEVRFERDEAAQHPLMQQLFYSEEVAVPAAVVERDGEQALALREAAKFERFRSGWRKGLVDDDMLAGFEHSPGQHEVGLVGSGYDYHFNGLIREGSVD